MVVKSRRLIRAYSSEEPLLLRLHRKSSLCRASAETIWYNAFVTLPKCNLLSASARQQISRDNTGLRTNISFFFSFLSYSATIKKKKKKKAWDVFEASCQINWFVWIICLVMCARGNVGICVGILAIRQTVDFYAICLHLRSWIVVSRWSRRPLEEH